MIWLFPVGLFCGVLVYQGWREWRHHKWLERFNDNQLILRSMDRLTDEEFLERMR